MYELNKEIVSRQFQREEDSATAGYARFLKNQTSQCHINSGCNSKFGKVKNGKDYAREELVAELGAFLMSNRLNISSDAANHASYLKGYAEVLKGRPKVLFKVLSDATKASNLILGSEVE